MEQYFLETDQCQLKVYSINPAQSHTAILFLHGGPGSWCNGTYGITSLSIIEVKIFHCLYLIKEVCGDSTYI